MYGSFTHGIFLSVNWKLAILKDVSILRSVAIKLNRCLIRQSLNCLIHFYKRYLEMAPSKRTFDVKKNTRTFNLKIKLMQEKKTMIDPLPSMVSRKDAFRLFGLQEQVQFQK